MKINTRSRYRGYGRGEVSASFTAPVSAVPTDTMTAFLQDPMSAMKTAIPLQTGIRLTSAPVKERMTSIPISKDAAAAINRGDPVGDSSGWNWGGGETVSEGDSEYIRAGTISEAATASPLTLMSKLKLLPLWQKLAIGAAVLGTIGAIGYKLRK